MAIGPRGVRNSDDWTEADFNYDGTVDGADFNLWNGNRFTSASSIQPPPPMVAVEIASAAMVEPSLETVVSTEAVPVLAPRSTATTPTVITTPSAEVESVPPNVLGLGIVSGLTRSDRVGRRDPALELAVAEFTMMRRLSLHGGVDLDDLDRHPLQTEEPAASRSSTHNRDSRNLAAIDSLFADPWDSVSRWKL